MNKENAHVCFKQVGVDMVLDWGYNLYYIFSGFFIKQVGISKQLGREVEGFKVKDGRVGDPEHIKLSLEMSSLSFIRKQIITYF